MSWVISPDLIPGKKSDQHEEAQIIEDTLFKGAHLNNG